ncbi:MAG: PIN domain-containing protein [Candidatus Aenigmarchaeota archaeon]|nr:PIN domain-containing protein [Candidatus Aenigmarchaeota archaeon]
MKIVFDTSILVDESRNYAPAVKLVEKVAKKEIEGCISGITEAEMLSGGNCKKEDVIRKTMDLLSLFTEIEIDKLILRKAAEFRRTYGTDLLDAIIAATAFHQNCRLWTKNKKDFEKIKDIKTEMPY